MSTPPSSAGASTPGQRPATGLEPGDQVQARRPKARAALGERLHGSAVSHGRGTLQRYQHGSLGTRRLRGRRAAADRQQLIRVMPAKRGVRLADLQHKVYDVAIVGGGVCGLVVAWRARARGLTVGAFRSRRAGRRRDACRGRHARAGHGGRRRRARASRRSAWQSARRWPSFADELRDVSGIDVGLPSSARCSSRATATRPRRSIASSLCASGSG